MDIWLFAQLFAGYAATLADVSIAGTGALALTLPVRTIVGVPAALPVGMILAGNVLREPSSAAIKVAEMFLMFQGLTTCSLQWGITVSAINVNIAALPVKSIFAGLGFAYPLAVAREITKVILITCDATACSHQWRAAAGTFGLSTTGRRRLSVMRLAQSFRS